MNYMSEVAKMFGVELEERFKLDLEDEYDKKYYSDNEYYLCDEGVKLDKAGHTCSSIDVLWLLISGQYRIKRKPWKPKDEEDDFWYVDADREICRFSHFCSKDADYMNYYKLGNCYRTKEEAEANIDKWVTFYASDEVLEV